MHSNRTLIWGLEIGAIFSDTHDVYFGPEDTFRKSLNLTCPLRGGGLFDCYFHPLSSCSLNHLSPLEMSQLGNLVSVLPFITSNRKVIKRHFTARKSSRRVPRS